MAVTETQGLLPLVLLAATVLTLVPSISGVDFATCMANANRTCQNVHIPPNITFCTSDGKKYHDVCEYVKAMCHNLTLLATGENCEHKIIHPTTTTPPPLSRFEIELFAVIRTDIDSLLMISRQRGIKPAQALPIFSVQDHDHKVYKRNPDCWAHSLDLTPLSPWNSNLKNKKAGTLISPRHAVWARHYSIAINSTIRFVDLHDNVIERRVVATRLVDHHPGTESFYGRDIVVGMLDSDLPSTISFAKVMPQNLTTVIARLTADERLPVLSTDQEEKALVADFYRYSDTSASLTTPLTTSIRHDYYEPKIGGDSGNPTFFVINDQLVLLFVFTSGGAGGGTNLNHHYAEINRLMKEMGGNYQLTPVDLSGFQHSHPMPHIIG